MVKNLRVTWEMWVWSLGQEDPLEKGMAIHSYILAWRIPWTETDILAGYSPWGQKGSHTTEWLHDWGKNLITSNRRDRTKAMLLYFPFQFERGVCHAFSCHVFVRMTRVHCPGQAVQVIIARLTAWAGELLKKKQINTRNQGSKSLACNSPGKKWYFHEPKTSTNFNSSIEGVTMLPLFTLCQQCGEGGNNSSHRVSNTTSIPLFINGGLWPGALQWFGNIFKENSLVGSLRLEGVTW